MALALFSSVAPVSPTYCADHNIRSFNGNESSWETYASYALSAIGGIIAATIIAVIQGGNELEREADRLQREQNRRSIDALSIRIDAIETTKK